MSGNYNPDTLQVKPYYDSPQKSPKCENLERANILYEREILP